MRFRNRDYDVVVVGAGHAGIEAAAVAVRLGCSVAMVTTNISRIGYMSCNPSIGGLGKGHIVKEIDVLGGLMGLAADENCIQFKRLNSRKGPAVRGSRAQCDKDLYCDYMKSELSGLPGLELIEGEAKELILENGYCRGIVLGDGAKIFSRSVVLTTGTFMKAVMYIGLDRKEGGRVGDRATIGISDQLAEVGFDVIRLKTGTPARLKSESIDWSKLNAQRGDEKFVPFSLRSKKELKLAQIECHIGYTNERTHEIIRNNLDKSPMYCGIIEGVGPRYCPSIEDKIVRFPDRDRHQTFLEPEGLSTNSIYLQGISTSLPALIQEEFLRSIVGLENVEMLMPGYAVEYDCIEPTQIRHTLETKLIPGLFLAGQINGTSGYEEAAGQGLVAGANAALRSQSCEGLILERSESYIGVMIDDLVTKGTREPYRMMTARAEFRLHLREDNVLERLHHKGVALGVITEEHRILQESLLTKRSKLKLSLDSTQIVPNLETQNILRALGSPVLVKPLSLSDLVRRNEISCIEMERFGVQIDADSNVWEAVEIDIKYSGYLLRQKEMIDQAQRMERLSLPDDMRYDKVCGLSLEEIEKLTRVKPRTLGQAGRISGVNPSAVQALVVYLKAAERRREREKWL